MNHKKTVYRSDRFMLSNQLQGFCNALHAIVAANVETGATTIKILEKLCGDVLEITHGSCVKNLPEIPKEISSTDILVFAEILKETNNTFLKPEEIKDLLNISNLPNNIDFFSKMKRLIKQ